MREEFEKWYLRKYPQSYMGRNEETDTYKVSIIQYAWIVWQAALATKDFQPQPNGL